MARHYSGSVGHRRAVPFQVTVLGLAAVLQRVHVLVGRVLVRAVRSVVVEAADLVVGIGVRVGSCLQHVQLRFIVGSLQQIVPDNRVANGVCQNTGIVPQLAVVSAICEYVEFLMRQ